MKGKILVRCTKFQSANLTRFLGLSLRIMFDYLSRLLISLFVKYLHDFKLTGLFNGRLDFFFCEETAILGPRHTHHTR
jgi:hypothetical protein